VNPEIAARLESVGINWSWNAKGYSLLSRGECAAFAHDQPAGLSLGSSGIMTEAGFAFLLWRDGQAYLAVHGGIETPATAEQQDMLRQFSNDLKAALAR
jgi:hypothetical protein